MAQARRRALTLAVCACCHEAGFTTTEESVTEILTVMLQSIITEAGKGSQALAEHNGRVEVTPEDVLLALIDMGINIDSLLEYGQRRNLIRIPAPGREQPQRKATLLQTGQTRPLPSHIPNHFPPFPDPHTYIRTTTHRQPVSEYEAIRERAATQKRDLERALTRFMAKTCESDPEHSLFGQNSSLNKYFPLVSIQPSPLSFMSALVPKDQIFDDSDDNES